MKGLFVPQTTVASLAAKTCCALFICVLFTVIGGALFAQTTSSVNPSPVPAEPAVKQGDDPPPGGCMPIGVTASGEIVFPLQCKGFIERQYGIAVQEKPAVTDEKRPASEEKPAAPAENPPAVEEKPPTRQSEAVVPETANRQIIRLKQLHYKSVPSRSRTSPRSARPVAPAFGLTNLYQEPTGLMTDDASPADKFTRSEASMHKSARKDPLERRPQRCDIGRNRCRFLPVISGDIPLPNR